MNEDQTSALGEEIPVTGHTMETKITESNAERESGIPTETQNNSTVSAELSEIDILSAANKTLEAQIQTMARENTDLKDQYLRARADFENTRKRLQRDKEESVQFANKQILVDVIGIVDDFERAIRSSEASRDFQSLYDGIGLIEKQFIGMLERKWGIQRFDAVGEIFDPLRHEAVAAEPRADLPEQSILEVYQKGYLLHEKVLRSAKVKVSLPA